MLSGYTKLSKQARWAIVFCLLASVVVSLGAYTRLVHAGLGCPDWPGCYGHLKWPDSHEEIQIAEMAFLSHRLIPTKLGQKCCIVILPAHWVFALSA